MISIARLSWFFVAAGSVSCSLPTSGTSAESTGAGGTSATTATGAGGATAAATATGTASTGTTTASTTSGSQGTGGGPVEDCMNGADDDGDSAADCEDTDCAAFTCVAAYPGAIAWITEDSAACGPLPKHELITCAACVCVPDVGTCEVSMTAYSSSNCDNDVVDTFTSPETCVDSYDEDRWFLGSATPRDDASCAPASSMVAATHMNACEVVTPGSCAGGEACVPVAEAAPWCVLVSGAASCVAPYTFIATVYDDDGSTSCDCTCEKGAQGCAPTFVLASPSSDNCFGTSPFLMDGTCQSAGHTESYSLADGEGQVSCAPTTVPENTPAPAVLTVCCLP